MSGRGEHRRRLGSVATFDDEAGYGTVSQGSGSWWFHCTAIADGSRHIEEGARVEFGLRPGRRGCWEAVEITEW
ncbi:MAG: cold shock domain-containing protein [Acidimicrobiales bacterium]